MRIQTINELERHVAAYRRIIVLGPQRSGTNFAADVIAEMAEIPLYSERGFGQTSCIIDAESSGSTSLEEFLKTKERYVMQAPALTHTCHALEIPNALICFMDRPADEIEASRKKGDWPGAKREREKYAQTFPDLTQEKNDERLADLQLFVWNTCQRDRMQMPFIELSFSVLSQHKRWVPPNERTEFKIGQTRPKKQLS